MITLALDLSTKSSGLAIFEDKKLIKYSCLTASSTDVIKRIQKITQSIAKEIEDYQIDNVVVEEVRPEGNQYGVGNQHTQKVLMWLQASIVFFLHDNYPKAHIEYVYPSSWRASCGIHTGRGITRTSLKTADIEFVKQTYGITVNDDIADAIGIGHSFVNELEDIISWE